MGEPGSFRVLVGRGKDVAKDNIGIYRRRLLRRVVNEVKILTTDPQDIAAARRALPLLIEKGIAPELAGLIKAEADTILTEHETTVASRRKAAIWIASGTATFAIGGIGALAIAS